MRTSGRSHIDHEGPRQRDRYKRKKHRPPESDAEKDKDSRDRQAQNRDLHEKPLPSLNNSKDVQFEIPRHGSRVAVTSPQTDLPGTEELCRTRSFGACKSRLNQRAVGKQDLKSRSRVRKSRGYAVLRPSESRPSFPLPPRAGGTVRHALKHQKPITIKRRIRPGYPQYGYNVLRCDFEA